MTEGNFDFSAFLRSPSASAVGRGSRATAGNGTLFSERLGRPSEDFSSMLGGDPFAPSDGLFPGGNELFDVPWDSIPPLQSGDTLVAASVPPAAIENPLGDAMNNNNILARARAASFNGHAPSNEPGNSFDGETNGAPQSNGEHAQPQPQAQPQTPSQSVTDVQSAYRAQILAHHSHLLRNGLGSNNARAGLPVKPMRGMASAPAVPLSSSRPSRAMEIADQAGKLTLQERRRLTRINQNKARKTPNVTPVKESNNVHVSGRAVKRTASGAETAKAKVMQQMKSTPLHSDELPPERAASRSQIALPTDHIYSSSGFDMLRALMRVAARPNPCVTIGPVDMSCSFTVADAQHPDQPLIYCSDTFCRLTGYERAEVYGRNCRFLQSPDGLVERGSERQSTDNQAVAHLSRHVSAKKECQASLINYRKDGQPFINLVTIVPITWDNSDQIRYLVGFQVDLVEQPGAILEKMPDGSYYVNYSSTAVAKAADLPPLFPAPSDFAPPMSRQVTTAEEMETEQQDLDRRTANAQSIAETIDGGHNDTKHWAKLLLDNSHDLIYVLSLKGTFLYVSPSIERLFGYKPTELIGKCVSEFAHPSDVVPVFRELKDSTSNASIAAAAKSSRQPSRFPTRDLGPTVNLIFRMRGKNDTHTWIESVGKLHLEQGKGRKVVVSSGRPRPVYHLADNVMKAVASSNEPGFWSKISFDGLFLNVTAPVVNMLGFTAHHMAGKTFKELCDKDSLAALTQALRTPTTTLVLHALRDTMTNRLPVLSTFYPSTGQEAEAVWVHTRKAPAELMLQANVVYSSPAKEADPNDVSEASVFAELSPFRSSSWCYELHQLRNLNKRLKEQVRMAHQRRAEVQDKGPRLSDAAMKDLMYHSAAFAAGGDMPVQPPQPQPLQNNHLLLPGKSGMKRDTSMSSGGRDTPLDSMLATSGSGSNSDSTRATSMSNMTDSGEGSGSGEGSRRGSSADNEDLVERDGSSASAPETAPLQKPRHRRKASSRGKK